MVLLLLFMNSVPLLWSAGQPFLGFCEIPSSLNNRFLFFPVSLLMTLSTKSLNKCKIIETERENVAVHRVENARPVGKNLTLIPLILLSRRVMTGPGDRATRMALVIFWLW